MEKMRQRVETTTNRQETMATTWRRVSTVISFNVIERDWRDKHICINYTAIQTSGEDFTRERKINSMQMFSLSYSPTQV